MVRAFAAVTVFAIVSPCLSQPLNIDFGTEFGGPADTFGAAAGQPGVWNTLVGSDLGPFPLVGLDGAPVAATLMMTLPLGNAGDPDILSPITDPDTYALMADYFALRTASVDVQIDGLMPGTYEVYAYGWSPDSSDLRTVFNIHVAGEELDDGNSWVLSGVWPGDFIEGITHATQLITLGAGESITIFARGIPNGSFNGIQLVPAATPACPADLTGDGGVDVFDLLEYLDAWFHGQSAAEWDGADGVDVFDLMAYLDNWFGGC
jgi:hypothetical protein